MRWTTARSLSPLRFTLLFLARHFLTSFLDFLDLGLTSVVVELVISMKDGDFAKYDLGISMGPSVLTAKSSLSKRAHALFHGLCPRALLPMPSMRALSFTRGLSLQ